jgi:protocatechuate 3,4-dioxygenase beta subunit
LVAHEPRHDEYCEGIVDERLSRRRFLELSAAATVPIVLAACGEEDEPGGVAMERAGAADRRLAPTPACDDGDEPTIEQTEGPFFTPSSPERTSLLESGLEGVALVVSGAVLSTACEPIAGAMLDFWQADASGEYDNEGFTLRGHQFADSKGRYRLETIVPGLYTGRTRHIHVKAQPENGTVLTTQLYFPGEPGNDADAIFDPRLLMAVDAVGGRRRARFDFVLEA